MTSPDDLQDELDRLRDLLRKIHAQTVLIGLIRWGYDGDCGASAIANEIEELVFSGIEHAN